jgi:hypothetical protein
MAEKFIRMDADGVGDKIELALLDDDIALAKAIHNAIRRSMRALIHRINTANDMEIIMVGCDDILIRMEAEHYRRNFLVTLMRLFNDTSGCTISIGVGSDLQEALLNLSKAKLSGKNKIVETG